MILVILGLIALLVSLFFLHRTQRCYQLSAVVYDTAAQTMIEVDEDKGLPFVDFHDLKMVNEDVCGWLYCPDTPINYPVVQEKDNSYYLTHLLDDSEGAYGTLFLDCESRPTDKNAVIYGHHMKDGSMLASLMKYQEPSYYFQHPSLYYITPEQAYEVRLFAGFATDEVSPAYNRTFEDVEFGDWLAEMLYQSDFTASFIPERKHQVLTLSTCAYSADHARYVVMGILVPL